MNTGSFARRLIGFALVPAVAALITLGAAHAQQGRDDHRDDHHDDHRQGPQQQGNDFHFQDQHRNNFQQHYGGDISRWQSHPQNRQHFERGQRVPANVRFQAVPSSYYRGAPPPPPGYRYGYSNGYVVAYNPATRIVADVLDLVTGH